MIEAKEVTHAYVAWHGDESYERVALKSVSLGAQDGEFIAILGANGSGKSTFAKHINALLLPKGGGIWIDGKSTSDEENVRAIRDIVGMVFQNPDNQIIGTNVEEDVAFGPENRNVAPQAIREKVRASLEAVRLLDKRKMSTHRLSGGQKQHVAIAGTLASDTRCIVLDEPTAMLDPLSRKRLMDILHELHEQGKTIILITHYADEAAGADRIIMMREGTVVAEGTPKEIFQQPTLLEACGVSLPRFCSLGNRLADAGMIEPCTCLSQEQLISAVARALESNGNPVSADVDTQSDSSKTHAVESNALASSEEVVLELKNVSFTYDEKTANEVRVLDDVSLQIRAGEFIGLVGASGSGKTTLVKHLNGLNRPTRGEVMFQGKSIFDKKRKISSVRKHVGVVFQHPESQLFCRTVLEDVAFGPKNLGMSEEDANQAAERSLQLVGIAPDLYDMSPFDLSGGQMRRVAIAGVLAMEPEVIVMDEPAAGLDARAKAEMFSLINDIRAQRQLTVVLVSHDMEDVVDQAQRVLVLNEGKLIMDGSPEQVFGQVDRIRNAGLDVPVAASVLSALADKGLPITTIAVTEEAAVTSVAQAFERKGATW